jgi:hypothetical protein
MSWAGVALAPSVRTDVLTAPPFYGGANIILLHREAGELSRSD